MKKDFAYRPPSASRKTRPPLRLERRAHLIEQLMLEIDHGTSVTGLYARLLIAELAKTDQRLEDMTEELNQQEEN